MIDGGAEDGVEVEGAELAMFADERWSQRGSLGLGTESLQYLHKIFKRKRIKAARMPTSTFSSKFQPLQGAASLIAHREMPNLPTQTP